MRAPTPVTNRVIVDDSGSTRNPKSTWIRPTDPREHLGRRRAPPASSDEQRKRPTDATNASTIIVVASQPAWVHRCACRTAAGSTEPAQGSAGITQTRSRTLRASTSALQQIDVVGGHVLTAPEDRDDDREADRHFGRGDDQREEDDRPGRRCRSSALANVTNVRFAALSINSMHMNITSVLRRTSMPTAPIVKSIAARIK